jgi:hypothetical protein
MGRINSYLSCGNHRTTMVVFFLCALLLSSLFYLFTPGGAASSQTAAAAAGANEAELRILLDNVSLRFDTQPLLAAQGPMLPLRVIGEQAGFTVHWDNEINQATLQRAGNIITLYPNNPLYAVNGNLKRTEQPPLLKDGRLLVSLDFLEKGLGLVLQSGDPQAGYLHLTDRQSMYAGDTDLREQPVYFVELLLPPEQRVEVQEIFKMHLRAPFVEGIFAYEVAFYYNPAVIQVIDLSNPTYRPAREFFLKEIDNNTGFARYTFTTLGYQDYLPPRDTLVVIEAVVYREGPLSLTAEVLELTLLDSRARRMPVGLEERVLNVGPET